VSVRMNFVAPSEAEYLSDQTNQAPAYLPVSYIAEPQPRIQAYRRLNEISTPEDLATLRKTWRDRFGAAPRPVENLLLLSEIKLAAAARKISAVEVKDDKVMLTRLGDFILISGKFPRVSARNPNDRLQETLTLLRSF
jgi:transcription-repair coupling factor (superfamily II helicase)